MNAYSHNSEEVKEVLLRIDREDISINNLRILSSYLKGQIKMLTQYKGLKKRLPTSDKMMQPFPLMSRHQLQNVYTLHKLHVRLQADSFACLATDIRNLIMPPHHDSGRNLSEPEYGL